MTIITTPVAIGRLEALTGIRATLAADLWSFDEAANERPAGVALPPPRLSAGRS